MTMNASIYPTLQGADWLLRATGGTLAMEEGQPGEGRRRLVLRLGDREIPFGEGDVIRPVIDVLWEARGGRQ